MILQEELVAVGDLLPQTYAVYAIKEDATRRTSMSLEVT